MTVRSGPREVRVDRRRLTFAARAEGDDELVKGARVPIAMWVRWKLASGSGGDADRASLAGL